MSNASNPPTAAQARATLATAYTELLAAAKVVVGDDGGVLLGAAAAIDLAVEVLTPPDVDIAMAASSCREALELAKGTRAYAPGGNIAKLLDPARQKIEAALKLLGA